jgi:hypothetical protein
MRIDLCLFFKKTFITLVYNTSAPRLISMSQYVVIGWSSSWREFMVKCGLLLKAEGIVEQDMSLICNCCLSVYMVKTRFTVF